MLLHRHFGLDYLKLRDDVGWGDYYCLLAKAMDAEELADYRYALLTHGSEGVKKWKWQSPDQAGTKPLPLPSGPTVVSDEVRALLQSAYVVSDSSAEVEFTRITGRRVLYKFPDGTITDPAGNEVEVSDSDLVIPALARGNG